MAMLTRVKTGVLLALLVNGGICSVGCSEPTVNKLEQVRQAIQAGKFSQATELIAPEISDSNSPAIDNWTIARELMRRIRIDYGLNAKQMLAKIKKSIPDATAADVDRWRKNGDLQHRIIDGEVRFFSREPSNLFRFCTEARGRRQSGDPEPAGEDFDVTKHVAKLVKIGESTGDTEIYPVKHHVTYTLKVKENHPRLKKGAKVRCWLPHPQAYRQQKEVKLLSASPASYLVAPNGTPQRTVYFEQIIDDPKKTPEFKAEFEFVTYAYYPKLNAIKVKPYDLAGDLFREYTAEKLPHIAFIPELRKTVKEVVGDEPNPLVKAKKLYRWVCENIRYCSEMEYGTIDSISTKAFTSKQGDCGVQGMLFITMCRIAGIPARWQSGWESLPNRSNMHDWTEFYVEPWGWLPADLSYGLQEHTDSRVAEFYCGHLDPYRMIVNLDFARELVPAKTSFRSEPNDFQRGEIEIDGHNLYFDEWDYTFEVQTVPLAGGLTAVEEALDAVVPKVMKRGNVPGAVILVGQKKGDKYQTWQKAYGYRQIKPSKEVMTSDAVFGLASMTKPIATGTSLMILADRGKVDVNDQVGIYLPEFNTEEKKDITIKQLMTHMSGEQSYIHANKRKKIEGEFGFPCRDQLRKYVRELKLSTKPGEYVVYSCLNAILTSEVVRVASGMEVSEFAAQNIFVPLGMTDTGYCPSEKLASRLVPSTKTAYGKGPDRFLLGQVHDPLAATQGGVSGNAGLFSTAGDLSRYAQMILNGGELDGVRILKQETVKRATTVQNPGAKSPKGYVNCKGLLWDVYCSDEAGKGDYKPFGHTGYTGTAIRFYPEQGVYIIALTNRVHPDDSGRVGPLREVIWKTVGEVLWNAK